MSCPSWKAFWQRDAVVIFDVSLILGLNQNRQRQLLKLAYSWALVECNWRLV